MCTWQEVEAVGNPEEEGLYFVYAPSADPKKPFMTTAWWSTDNKQWELIIKVWGEAITHWAKQVPPNMLVKG
jgi:hypothetical protein